MAKVMENRTSNTLSPNYDFAFTNLFKNEADMFEVPALGRKIIFYAIF